MICSHMISRVRTLSQWTQVLTYNFLFRHSMNTFIQRMQLVNTILIYMSNLWINTENKQLSHMNSNLRATGYSSSCVCVCVA